MLNLGCGQYLRNPFFPGFWGQKWGCGFCILADYTRLYTVLVQSKKMGNRPDMTENCCSGCDASAQTNQQYEYFIGEYFPDYSLEISLIVKYVCRLSSLYRIYFQLY